MILNHPIKKYRSGNIFKKLIFIDGLKFIDEIGKQTRLTEPHMLFIDLPN